MKITIWHNIMWSKYKAVVWSELNRLCSTKGHDLHIYQVAETENDRSILSPVDKSLHDYPYTLLFQGSYSKVPTIDLIARILNYSLKDDSNFVILTGYQSIEHWAQIFCYRMTGKRVGLFCDSTLYDHNQTFFKSLAKRIIFSQAELIFCYGERAAQYLKHHGVPESRIRIRNQTPALPANYTAENAFEQRIARRAEAQPNRYLYVGRLSPEKSIDTLIDAFSIIAGTDTDARLVIIGRGPEEERLRLHANNLGVLSRIEFLGAKHGEGLELEYQLASCLVLPSKSEPWGLVVDEALSYGCPVIVSHRCGCVPELVNDGVTGFSFAWGDIIAMSEAMTKIRGSSDRYWARNCINHVAHRRPQNAASSILNGILEV